MTSSDVSVSALRARSMADAVSAGILAAVEELVIPPLANWTLSTSAVAEVDAVVGRVALGSVSFLLGNTVTGVEATRFG